MVSPISVRSGVSPLYYNTNLQPRRVRKRKTQAPFAMADSSNPTGQTLAVPTSALADAKQRVATGPQPCDLHADSNRHLRCEAGRENGSKTRYSMVLCDGCLRSSLRTCARRVQPCAGSTTTSSSSRAVCVAGTHWSPPPSLPPRPSPSPPILSHPHPHPSPPHSPPPARAGGMLSFFCALVSIMVFALRRAMGAGCEGLVSVAGVQIWQAVVALLPAGAKRWATAVRSKWVVAAPALRGACKPRSTPALQVHRRALGLLAMAQIRCGHGRRIKHPHSAGRRGSGHALRLLVHLVLLSAASGWRLPNSQKAPPDAEAVRFPQRENADMFVETLPLTADARVAIVDDAGGARDRRRLVGSGCDAGWSVSPAPPLPFLLRDQPCRCLLPAATHKPARARAVLVTVAVFVT